MIVESVFWLVIASYTLFTLALYRTWNRIRTFSQQDPVKPSLFSVIIPVRNEAGSIEKLLGDLSVQTLPVDEFEVLVMDDASTDGTAELVEAFRQRSSIRLLLFSLPENGTAAPKKRAIALGIERAKGQVVVTTDGDCRVGPDWLSSIKQGMADPSVQMLAGPVTFVEETRFTDHIQTVELASLIGSTACCLSWNKPTMCNGANLAYRKDIFKEVGGFQGNEHVASGDDEFLMHKVAHNYPGGVRFLKDYRAVVRTAPHRSWTDFRSQRQRWAGKWKYYTSFWPKALGMYIFLCNLVILCAAFLSVGGGMSGYTLLALLGLKWLPEWLLLSTVLRFLGKENSIIYILPTQLIYSFYVVFFGIVSQGSRVAWKGRELR